MIEKYENENLPFQDKIVCCIVPPIDNHITEIIEHVAKCLEHLYGIVMLIYGNTRIAVVTSSKVKQSVIREANRRIDCKPLEEVLEIVPFPKL